MKRNFRCVAIIVFVFSIFTTNSYSFNAVSLTPSNLGKDFIRIIKTSIHKSSAPSKNMIDMYIENGDIIIAKHQNITIHINEFVLVDGDRINNIGKQSIKVINSDGSEVFVAPGVKNKVLNGRIEIIKWYEIWK